MKIAEALALRADLQKRLEQLKQRLVRNARIQEGDTPEEDPAALQAELEKSARELTVLIQRINRTNAASPFGDGTLADRLAERDVLNLRYNAYGELANAASASQSRKREASTTLRRGNADLVVRGPHQPVRSRPAQRMPRTGYRRTE